MTRRRRRGCRDRERTETRPRGRRRAGVAGDGLVPSRCQGLARVQHGRRRSTRSSARAFPTRGGTTRRRRRGCRSREPTEGCGTSDGDCRSRRSILAISGSEPHRVFPRASVCGLESADDLRHGRWTEFPVSRSTETHGRRPIDTRNACNAGTTVAARSTAAASNSARNSLAGIPFRYPGQRSCNWRRARAVVAGSNRSHPRMCFRSSASRAGCDQIARTPWSRSSRSIRAARSRASSRRSASRKIARAA